MNKKTPYHVEALAKQLYDECSTPKPNWDQLQPNGATQSVWIERAEKMLRDVSMLAHTAKL